jgi:uncharacterized lipoprotein YddW (UPF0748 family)
MRRHQWNAVVLGVLAAGVPAAAQHRAGPSGSGPAWTATRAVVPPPLTREFRGVWVATVGNIDWPSAPGLSTGQQRAELTAIFDRAAALHLNAVIFQVRPAADAMYASSLEPWSSFLTGRMGQAPDPLWDPLAFAVRAAHARGLELHAWFNPFRARYPGDAGPAARSHVSRRDPAAMRRYGRYLWMDPGSAQARRQAMRVILDVVKRYDIDGVHIDDTFYPYPVTAGGVEVPFPDGATYRAYRASGGTLDRDAWRRHNVDSFVQQMYTAIKREKRWVKVGISPFGIWRPGNPPGVQGFDAYAHLYTDSRKWLAEGWVDYLAPQLYWPIARPEQSYADLLAWWVDQNAKSRNLWAGNYAARVAGTAGGSEVWPASEILDQVRLTREVPGVSGDVFFSMSTLMSDPDSLDERLLAGPYAAPALVPAFPWLGRGTPARPVLSVARGQGAGALVARLATASGQTPWQWVVQTRLNGIWRSEILPGDVREYTVAGNADAVSLIAVDRVGSTSQPAVAIPATDH